MTNFEQTLPKILRWEGGYSNDPLDRGLESYRGISRKYHPEWIGWKVLDKIPDKDYNEIFPQLEGAVRTFYEVNYWDKYKINKFNEPKAAGFLCDWIINSGKNAIKRLQRICEVEPDGIIGDKTIAAANKVRGLFDKLKISRLDYVEDIVRDDPSQARYLAGWKNRISSFT